MNTDTTYANQGACRRAAKKALGPNAERGVDFEMKVLDDGRWMWWKLEAPRSSGATLTREEWLREITQRLHDEVYRNAEFNEHHVVVPAELPHYRVSCGFPGGGSARKHIGECWSSTSSRDGAIEMFISPMLDDAMTVASTLAHEMAHMYLGIDVGHKAPFKHLVHAIGLEGKAANTVAGERFTEKVQPILDDMGPYPHASLLPGSQKKQTTRLLKVTCVDEACGCVFRITSKWVDRAERDDGNMYCPACGNAAEVE